MTEYVRGAWLYDKMYGFKDYRAEASKLVEAINARAHRPLRSLLDVACGTGKHLEALSPSFSDLAGVDITPSFVEAARARVPNADIRVGDMKAFDFGRRFDIVTCLFSAIGYAATEEGLNAALRCFAEHTEAGGVVAVEPWLSPAEFKDRHVHALHVDEPDLKITRINNSERVGAVSRFVFHYLIGTPDGVEHLTERHELTLFTDAQYRAAFEQANLEVAFEAEGLTGRGLYLGTARA